MARDEVVFESERYERRRQRNRWLIPVLGVLAVILIVIVVALILRGGRAAVVSGGEDTPYPYVWTANGDGTVTLAIDCSASPGYSWRITDSSSELSVSPGAPDKTGRTVFTIEPSEPGRASLSYVLASDTAGDRIYELHFLAEITQGRRALIARPLSVSGHPIQGLLRGGEGSDFPYSIQTDGDGDLVVAVFLPDAEADLDGILRALAAEGLTEETKDQFSDEEIAELIDRVVGEARTGYDWDGTSSDESVALPIGTVDSGNVTVAYFRPGANAGTATLRVFDPVSGACVTVECENSAESGLLVRSHALTTG